MKCSRIYFVCMSGLNFDEQRFGTTVYEGLLEYACVSLSLSEHLRVEEVMRKNLGCFELFTGKAKCVRHHFGVAARLEEGTWGCCDRPALCYQWVYNVHGLKTLHIRYPTDTLSLCEDKPRPCRQLGNATGKNSKTLSRSPSLLPALCSPASHLISPLRENINTTLLPLQRHTVRLPRRVQQGTPVVNTPHPPTQARPLSPASPTSLLLLHALPHSPFFLPYLESL